MIHGENRFETNGAKNYSNPPLDVKLKLKFVPLHFETISLGGGFTQGAGVDYYDDNLYIYIHTYKWITPSNRVYNISRGAKGISRNISFRT